MTHALILMLCLMILGCGSSGTDRVTEFNTIPVRLPDGTAIRAEVMSNPRDMARGMMFRDSLPADRGMLFLHAQDGKYPYWMFQVKIPLDLIWLDRNKRVVELVPNAPACDKPQERAKECPSYGGTVDSLYVLELGAGQAAKHSIQVGSTIDF